MTKHKSYSKRKMNYASMKIQTKRNPHNDQKHKSALQHANLLKRRAAVHNLHVNNNSKRYA